MAKWSYIANAVFRIVQNHGEKVYLVGFTGAIAPPLDWPLGSGCRRCSLCKGALVRTRL